MVENLKCIFVTKAVDPNYTATENTLHSLFFKFFSWGTLWLGLEIEKKKSSKVSFNWGAVHGPRISVSIPLWSESCWNFSQEPGGENKMKMYA